ncbi:MAG: Asp-tRNA(Asn)/Glu-tRNA(Gln) amidotransferase subunit GatC [Bacilli bacterium]
MDKLNKNDIKHVALLARLKINDEELENYEIQLNDILTDLNKISETKIEGDIMITPSNNRNRFNEDEVLPMIDKNEVLKRANKTNGDFITVSRVIND